MQDAFKISVFIICAVAFSALLAFIIVSLVNHANSDSIDACMELGGEVVTRGFKCELPSGIVVNPIKWKEGM